MQRLPRSIHYFRSLYLSCVAALLDVIVSYVAVGTGLFERHMSAILHAESCRTIGNRQSSLHGDSEHADQSEYVGLLKLHFITRTSK